MSGDASVVDVAAAVAAAAAAAHATSASQWTQVSASRLLQATTCTPPLHRNIWRENATRQSVSGDGDIAFGDNTVVDVVVGDGGSSDDTPDGAGGSNSRGATAMLSCTAAAAATSGALQASQRWMAGEQLLAGVHDDAPSVKWRK